MEVQNEKTEKKERRPWREYLIAFFFLLLIYLVPLKTLIRGRVSGESDGLLAAEKTEAVAAMPMQRIQGAVDDFTSHLFLKSDLIRINRALVRAASNETYLASTQVLAGKDYWLFFKSETDGETIADYMGTNRYSEARLEQLAAQFMRFEEKLKARGIVLYVLCIPDKEIVYEEYMPDNYVRLYTPSRGEQLSDYINANTELTMLYPREVLQREKAHAQMYYKTDTHWNHKGAFVVLQEFFKTAYGESRALDSVRFAVPWDDYAGDLAHVAGVERYFRYMQDEIYTLDVTTIDPAQYHDQCILIIGDSFADYLCAEAAPYYREAYSVGVGAYNDSYLDLYQPDIVIWETGERRLTAFE